MGYKGLIIKIQKLKANYDREIAEIEAEELYCVPFVTKDTKIKLYKKFSDELDKILESEQYGMKKRFKY